MPAWQTHFQNAVTLDIDSFCVRHFDRVQRRVARIRANGGAHAVPGCNAGIPFTGSELQDALSQSARGKAPGCDGIPYEALRVDIAWWQDAILQLFELCHVSSCIPTMWKHGNVVSLSKGAISSDRNNYRPITLTSCLAKNT